MLLCGLLPYASLLGQIPWGADATRWVTDGSLDNPRWWNWATSTKHFIGFRPITALSYVFNHATTGYSGFGYRALDMTAHLLIGLLVFALFRSWTGDRAGWGLVAVVLVCGHPATEEVLPYLARRSYLLATLFALLALVMWSRACRDPRPLSPWAPMAALSVGLAVLSNELAYAIVPLMPVLAWSHGPDRARLRGLAQWLPTVMVCTLAAYKRWLVLGSLRGGYSKRYFAIVVDNKPMWRELKEVDHLEIAAAAWGYLLNPISVSGHDPLYTGVGLGLLVAALAAFLWWTLRVPWATRQFEHSRVPWLLALWTVGATLLVMLSETWFWRQGYLLLLPFSLWVAWAVRHGAHTLGGSPPRRWLPRVLPVAMLVASMLWNSPYWGGMDNKPHGRRIQGKELVHTVRDLTQDIEGPALVWLVVPARSSRAHMVRIWANRYGDDRQVTFKLLAHLGPTGKQLGANAELVTDPEGIAELVLDEEHFEWATTPGAPAIRAERRTRVDRLWSAGRRTGYLLLIDTDEAVLIEAPAPPGRTRLPATPRAPPLSRPR